MQKLLLLALVLVLPAECFAQNQTTYSSYCKDSANQNNLPDFFCWLGQQIFNTNPNPAPNTIPTTGLLTNVQLLVHHHSGQGAPNAPVSAFAVYYHKKNASAYCYFPASDETIPDDSSWLPATFTMANATDGNTGGHTSNCDINFTAGEKLEYINLNAPAWDFAWTDHNIYTDGTSQQNYTSFGSSPDHSLWFKINEAPMPACNPPHSIFSDDTGTGGLAQTVISNQSLAGGFLIGDIKIQNQLGIWLGVVYKNVPSGVQLVPNLNAGVAGAVAALNLVPPCLGAISCNNPGEAAWTAGYCSRGTIEVDLGFTGLSAAVTIVDSLIPGTPVGTLVGISNKLYNTVPTFKAASDCYVAGDFSCTSSSFLTLARDPIARGQIGAALESFGITFTSKELVKRLLGIPVTIIQKIGYVTAFDIQTGAAGHLGIEIIKVIGQ